MTGATSPLRCAPSFSRPPNRRAKTKLEAVGCLLLPALSPRAPAAPSWRVRCRQHTAPYVSRSVRWPGLGTEAGMADRRVHHARSIHRYVWSLYHRPLELTSVPFGSKPFPFCHVLGASRPSAYPLPPRAAHPSSAERQVFDASRFDVFRGEQSCVQVHAQTSNIRDFASGCRRRRERAAYNSVFQCTRDGDSNGPRPRSFTSRIHFYGPGRFIRGSGAGATRAGANHNQRPRTSTRFSSCKS